MGENAHSSPTGIESAEYRRIYEAWYPRVLAYCVRRVGRQDAYDLAAEVFAVAWKRSGNLPDDQQLLPWLYGVAWRVVSHHWRSKGRRQRLTQKLGSQPATFIGSPESVVVQHHDYQLVLQAASNLRPKDQEVLRLVLWEELSHGEIAELLGSSVAAVRQRFHRAKKMLAKEFERTGGTLPPPAAAQEGGGR